MEKQAVISPDLTPPDHPEPGVKQAASNPSELEEHPTKRAADAVEEQLNHRRGQPTTTDSGR